MGLESWEICPIWFIPAAVVWACLESLCDHYHISDRLSKRYGWHKRSVQKWQKRITAFVSLAVTLILITAISILTGFNLISWEWFG